MTPAEQYSNRRREREALCLRLTRVHQRLGSVRLGLGALFLIVAWAALGPYRVSAAWILVPVALFMCAVFYHQRLLRLRAQAQRAMQFYQAGLERLQGRWQGRGLPRAAPSLAHHVYAEDLDLFGEDSLYSLLSAARTVMGESTLASWLLGAAKLEVIRNRHDCVRELRERTDLREDLNVCGEPALIALHPEVIVDWATAAPALDRRWLPALATVLVAAALATAAIWAVWGTAAPLIIVLVAEIGVTYGLRTRIGKAIAAVENAYEDVKLLAALLERLEREKFEAAPLKDLKARLTSHSLGASAALAKLATIVNMVESRRIPFSHR